MPNQDTIAAVLRTGHEHALRLKKAAQPHGKSGTSRSPNVPRAAQELLDVLEKLLREEGREERERPDATDGPAAPDRE